MDSKSCIRLFVRSLFLLILVVITEGCLDPDREIEFLHGSKYKEELMLSVMGDTLKIKLEGYSSIPVCCSQYSLHFGVHIWVRHQYQYLTVHPDSLTIDFGSTRMLTARKRCDTTENANHIAYDYYYSLTCNPSQALYSLDKVDALDSSFIKIFIGSMIWCDGKKIEIDTVYARDPKVKNFSKEIKKYLRR